MNNVGRSVLTCLMLCAGTFAPTCTAADGQTGQAVTPAPVSAPAPLPGDIASHPDWPAAAPADVDSVDHLIAALYDVISGPAGKPRDWNRFRSLFLPDGRLAPIRSAAPAKDGQPAQPGDITFLTPGQYVERAGARVTAMGFFERGIASRTEQFGDLVHVWTTYESRRAAIDAAPFARGINSVQIVHAAGRFWIATVQWDAERPGLSLPDKYLSSPTQ